MSVISCVEGATDRVNNLVIVEKKNESLRLCLDPPDLNHAIKGEFNHPSSKQISNKRKEIKISTIMDMSDYYRNKKLCKSSS